MSDTFYITTPIYYASDRPHIGHAYTTIAADVLARYNRQQGKDVYFSVGTDDHGSKVVKYADKAGMEPQEYTDIVHNYYKDAWAALDIEYDYFVRTTDKNHKAGVQAALQKAYDAGHFYKKEYSGLYCVGCEAFLREGDLKNGKCPDHLTEPEELTVENWFFRQSAFAQELEALIENDSILVQPQSRKNEILQFIRDGLEDVSISRHKDQLTWGVELPFDTDHVTYVWFDALLNYCTLVGYNHDMDNFNRWWPANLQLVGKDILRFHAILWPTMLLALDLPLPKAVYGHGFFTIDGQKMSKTIGNVIDPKVVARDYGADVVRYFVLAEIAFGQDGDFSFERLEERYSSDLANGIGNLVSRTVTLCEKLGPFAPDFSLADGLRSRAGVFWPEYHEHIAQLEFHFALEKIRELAAECDRYLEEHEPWKLIKSDPDKAKAVLSALVETIAQIKKALQPFIPKTAEKIAAAIAYTESEINLHKIEPLFPRRES